MRSILVCHAGSPYIQGEYNTTHLIILMVFIYDVDMLAIICCTDNVGGDAERGSRVFSVG